MSKRDYYRGGCRAIIGGVPVRLAFPVSKQVLEIMREGGPGRYHDKTAIPEAYARWLAARDGVSLETDAGAKVKAIPVEEVPTGKAWRDRRVKAVRFEAGYEVGRSYYSNTPGRWVCEAEIATIEIPHWDHEPSVIETTFRDLECAA